MLALVNPFNNLVEQPALLEALVAAENKDMQEQEKKKERDAKRAEMTNECGAEYRSCR